MSKRFEHDIALSFSEKDIEIAQELSKALQSYSVNLKTFQYEEKGADQYGHRLPERSIEVYMENSRHALVLASRHYDTGGWASFEWNLIKAENSKRPYRYLLVIRLDDTHIKGLSEDLVFRTWNNNSFELANLINQVVDADRQLSDSFENAPEKGWKSKVPKWLKSFIMAISKDIAVKIIVSLITSVLLLLLAIHPDWTVPVKVPKKHSTDSSGTKPITIPPKEKTTDLILTRSEKYEGRNIYVNGRQTAVFREYIITIPGLKLDDKITIGTDDSQEFILTITNTHLENESFRYYIE